MIGDLYPPWIFPKQGETVKAFRPLRKSLIAVTYDFEAQRWIDMKSQPIEIYGWIKK